MTTPTPASGTRRLAVRREWYEPLSLYAPTKKRHNRFQQPIITIENPPPSLTPSKLKRLAEIAAMDFTDGEVRYLSIRANVPITHVQRVLAALGLASPTAQRLSPKNSKKGRK